MPFHYHLSFVLESIIPVGASVLFYVVLGDFLKCHRLVLGKFSSEFDMIVANEEGDETFN